MLILLSPAKNLNFAPAPSTIPRSTPVFTKETATLANAAKKLSAADLIRLMDISPKLAELNRERFRAFAAEPADEASKQAALAFDGDVYRGLDAASLSEADLVWAQDRLRILSGLYGVLRPLDAIQPYRLEMGVKFGARGADTLYEYWRKKVTAALNADAQGKPIINLASEEYAGAVERKLLKPPIIDVAFKEVKDGKARPIFMYVKRARGLMARFAIERRIDDAHALRSFDAAGYRLDADASTDLSWVFTRPQPAPKAG
jgi:cytoplasmic iron level regulating protein YaaA (DUF328/UPF0246 family)